LKKAAEFWVLFRICFVIRTATICAQANLYTHIEFVVRICCCVCVQQNFGQCLMSHQNSCSDKVSCVIAASSVNVTAFKAQKHKSYRYDIHIITGKCIFIYQCLCSVVPCIFVHVLNVNWFRIATARGNRETIGQANACEYMCACLFVCWVLCSHCTDTTVLKFPLRLNIHIHRYMMVTSKVKTEGGETFPERNYTVAAICSLDR